MWNIHRNSNVKHIYILERKTKHWNIFINLLEKNVHIPSPHFIAPSFQSRPPEVMHFCVNSSDFLYNVTLHI